MTANEVANVFIKLRQEGWDDTKIGDFIVFLGTHSPSAQETEEAKKI